MSQSLDWMAAANHCGFFSSDGFGRQVMRIFAAQLPACDTTKRKTNKH